MVTLKEIIYNIKNLRAAGKQTDEVPLSDRQYAFIIDYYRAKLIKERYEAGHALTKVWVQNLGKITVKDARKSEDCHTNRSCDIFVTPELPTPIVGKDKDLWTFIGPSSSNIPYHRTTFTNVEWALHAPYTNQLTKWYDHNHKIYIVTPDYVKYINVQGIFEEPYEAYKLSCKYQDKPWDPFDWEYPINNQLLDSLYKLMTSSETKIATIVPQDLKNDGVEVIPVEK